jgi:hypothetical protein
MCDASGVEKITASSDLADLFTPYFPRLDETETSKETSDLPTYSVVYRGRSNEELHREDLQKVCASLIAKSAKVEYKQPKLVIAAEVIKTVCAFTIMDNEDYIKFKKFNIEGYIKGI